MLSELSKKALESKETETTINTFGIIKINALFQNISKIKTNRQSETCARILTKG